MRYTRTCVIPRLRRSPTPGIRSDSSDGFRRSVGREPLSALGRLSSDLGRVRPSPRMSDDTLAIGEPAADYFMIDANVYGRTEQVGGEEWNGPAESERAPGIRPTRLLSGPGREATAFRSVGRHRTTRRNGGRTDPVVRSPRSIPLVLPAHPFPTGEPNGVRRRRTAPGRDGAAARRAIR